jgi:hypothetical protein
VNKLNALTSECTLGIHGRKYGIKNSVAIATYMQNNHINLIYLLGKLIII